MSSPPTFDSAGDNAGAAEAQVHAVRDAARLDVLSSYGILDTQVEQGFDDIVLLATQVCSVPVALVSLVDRDRQWFKARVGFEPFQTTLDRSVCAYALGRTDILQIEDLTQDSRTRGNPLVTEAPHLRFYAGAPLTSPEGQTLGTICVIDHVSRPGGLTKPQVDGLRALARQVMALLAFKRTVRERDDIVVDLDAAHRSASDSHLRLDTMFQQAPSFMAMVRGPNHRFESVNPAYRRLIGDREVLGLTVAEGLPDAAAQGFLDLLDTVYRTGEPYATRGARYAVQADPDRPATDRYLDFVYQPVQDADGAVVGIFVEGSDVTERVHQARRLAALSNLSDLLRDLFDADAIVHASAKCLAETLGATRTGFGTVRLDDETIVVPPDWHRSDVASVAGQHSFRTFGSYIEELKRGETVVIQDVATDARTAAEAKAFEAIQARSLVNLPIMERGRLSLLVFVHQHTKYAWDEDELLFIGQVGDRAHAALARLRAEQQQQLVNQEISHRLKNTLAMVQAIASQTLRQVTERDAVKALTQRIGALSQAHEVLLHQNWTEARIRDVTQAVLSTFEAGQRFMVEGPDVLLGPRATLSYSLLLHEMGTNAMKYGALSVPDGRVEIVWQVIGQGVDAILDMTWHEVGGPPATAPVGRGFGSRLIGMGLLGTGGVELAYSQEGLTARMQASLSQMQQS
ncbi:HWE histidine kinase domain-containing protein [Aureimonas ureilytica]|uniref:HWE histidine kinase domain-containing protein n=1 Tax=Aureimonas ureilytica TaxID=401562 RepID=UPI00037E1E9D|nr:HWE histidine kinase domain-containing protein [Aureimonas ureilytica]